MHNRKMLELLERADRGQLPELIDQSTLGTDLKTFKELRRGGFLEAIDASADDGDCYLESAITIRGRDLLYSLRLEHQTRRIGFEERLAVTQPWWSNFDSRIAVVALVVALLSLASGAGLLVVK